MATAIQSHKTFLKLHMLGFMLPLREITLPSNHQETFLIFLVENVGKYNVMMTNVQPTTKSPFNLQMPAHAKKILNGVAGQYLNALNLDLIKMGILIVLLVQMVFGMKIEVFILILMILLLVMLVQGVLRLCQAFLILISEEFLVNL